MDTTQAPESMVTEQPVPTSPAGEQAAPDSAPAAGQAETKKSEQPAGTPAHSGMEEDSFFDPKLVPPELMPAYKQMQARFTKAQQKAAQVRQQAEIFSTYEQALRTNPEATLRQLAQQYGYDVAKPGQTQPGARTQPDGAWEPQSWDEVLQRATQLAKKELMGELGPVIQQVQETRAQNIERQLDEVDPDWRDYEDEMRASLREHPTLAKNAALLYRLSVPEDVQQQKAVQVALRRLEKKTQSAQAGAGAGTSQVRSTPAPGKVSSFQDAVDEARRQLQQR